MKMMKHIFENIALVLMGLGSLGFMVYVAVTMM